MLLRSLPSCAFKNEEVHLKKIRGVIKAGARLLTQDIFRILRPILDNATNTSSTLKKLGLPDEWRGINRAVNYLRLLNKHKDNKKKLTPMAKRVAQVLLYLNYMSLLKEGEPDVVTHILNNYLNDPSESEMKASHRNFHTYHLQLGRWWWRLAAHLGYGILLVADNLAKEMLSGSFSNIQINAFITFTLRTHPGTIHLYHSLAPVAISLLSRKLPANLHLILMDANKGLLRYNALEEACTQDKNASRGQEIVYP